MALRKKNSRLPKPMGRPRKKKSNKNSNKGGRKKIPIANASIKTIIRRALEVAQNPDYNLQVLEMAIEMYLRELNHKQENKADHSLSTTEKKALEIFQNEDYDIRVVDLALKKKKNMQEVELSIGDQ